MLRSLVLIALIALIGRQAHAGAWPKEAGTGFVASSIRALTSDFSAPPYGYSTFYVEYGLTARLTIGLDVGRGVSGKDKTIGFLRLPVRQGKSGAHWAAEFGIGQIAGENSIRPGLSFGRGFTAGSRSGWIALDSFAEYRLASKRIDFKTDITFGLNYSTRLKGIIQLQTGVSSGDPSFLRLAPSVVMRAGKNSNIELGLTAGLVGDNTIGVTLGYWRNF